MQFAKSFDIEALWQNRVESAPALANRMRTFLDASAPLPPDLRWYVQPDEGGYVDVDREPGSLLQYVESHPFPDDEGRPMPNMGFSCLLLACRGTPSEETIGPWCRLSAGGDRQNHFKLFTDVLVDNRTDPRLVTYDAMKANLLAAARAFEPDWCQAGPIELMRYYDLEVYNRPAMGLAWMIWLCPSLAAMVRPPVYTRAKSERLSDGSLFMAATTETFECANTLHLDAARDIHRQIDPLNFTVPFCGRKGRSPRVPPFPQV